MVNNETTMRIDPAYQDLRGEIINFLRFNAETNSFKIVGLDKTNIPDTDIVEVAYITFNNSGDIRANHYHPEPVHQYVYCLAGSYNSYSQKLKKDEDGGIVPDGEIQTIVIKKGDIVHTPPLVAHAMKTLEPNTIILNLNPRLREEEHYDQGENPHTVKFKLIE